MSNYRGNLMVCGGTGCIDSGGLKVKDSLEAELKARELDNEFKVVITGCNGFCAGSWAPTTSTARPVASTPPTAQSRRCLVPRRCSGRRTSSCR
ncbi:hypothetical protein LCGC14_3072140, partial [marine sediment metagenome]